MLAILADLYTPLLAICWLFLIKPHWSKIYFIGFAFTLLYVSVFAWVEVSNGWWAAMDANFSSHTAVVMVFVLSLLKARLKAGIIAWLSVFPYAFLMTLLNYHSWFDVLTTMFVCLPCYWVFYYSQSRTTR